MSTFLIETTEQDSFLAVARYIGDLLLAQSEVRAQIGVPAETHTAKATMSATGGRAYGQIAERLDASLRVQSVDARTAARLPVDRVYAASTCACLPRT